MNMNIFDTGGIWPIVKLENVHKHFGQLHAVRGVDLVINRGESVALVGPNGSGKTTLVEMIEGIQKPTKGNIRVDGLTWDRHEAEIRKILGFSFQETSFFKRSTVREILCLFASFYGLKAETVDEILALVSLGEKEHFYPGQLSGGQRQRMALGIALLNQPEILILDEPSTGLDPRARRELWEILKRLMQQENMSLLLTTHYMEEVSFLCKKIVILYQGKIVAEGTLEELLQSNGAGEIIDYKLSGNVDLTALYSEGYIKKVNYTDEQKGGIIIVDNLVESLAVFMEYIRASKERLTSIECRKMTLDDFFINMTEKYLQT